MQKEIKIFEKHGGRYLWGAKQDAKLNKKLKQAEDEHTAAKNKPFTAEEKKNRTSIIKKEIQEEILSMTIIKRADKRRYGNLQIQLHNWYLVGRDEYPKTIADTLKVLNNFKLEWKNGINPESGSQRSIGHQGGNRGNGITMLQTQGTSPITIQYLRGTNNSFFFALDLSFVWIKRTCSAILSSGDG